MELKIACEDNISPSPELTTMLEDILSLAAKAEELPAGGEVSLLLCGNDTILELNSRYRHKDSSTDVLSFPMYASREEMQAETQGFLLGDIVISLDKAREQSESYGHSLEREVGFLFLHGFLHLVGYQHDLPADTAKMRHREESILELGGLGRNRDAGPQV